MQITNGFFTMIEQIKLIFDEGFFFDFATVNYNVV